jgi:hypothetical protein
LKSGKGIETMVLQCGKPLRTNARIQHADSRIFTAMLLVVMER